MKNKKFLIVRLFNRILNLRIFRPLKALWKIFLTKMEKSIRFELVVVFGICFVIAFIAYGISNRYFTSTRSYSRIEYDYSHANSQKKQLINRLKNKNGQLNIENKNQLNDAVNSVYSQHSKAKIFATDLEGNIIFKTDNFIQAKVDLSSTIDQSIKTMEEMNDNEYSHDGSVREIIYFYPINIDNKLYYLFISDAPFSRIVEENVTTSNSILAILFAIFIFILSFLYITNEKMKYLQTISNGLQRIAAGDLFFRIDEKGKDELKNLAGNINFMAWEINNKIEAERKSEKTKNELITNVSHDLRTPLTSIMGYIGLVKEEKYENKEQMKEYLNIAFNKSEKLKSLIDDLFEYTKLANGNIALKKTTVDIGEFLYQLIEELMPIFDESNLEVITKFPDNKLEINLDPSKMLRVFENLLSNAIKYAYKSTPIIISITERDEFAIIRIDNKGDNIPKEKVSKLFDRFYRMDESRSSQKTEGTGLGLAICKNIIDLHGGSIWSECFDNDISFFVKLKKQVNDTVTD